MLPRLAGSGAAGAFKWTLSVVLVLPQSVLLGMTFPLMAAGVLRSFSDRPGRSLALLYFTNSLGAAAGVLVSGFVLIPLAGLPGTIRAAGLVNLAVAALVYRQSRGGAAPAPAAASASRDGALFAFLAVSLITGASSFIYEVSWIRMLSMVLGASTHSFELMLSAFILGLALGGLWIQRRIDGLQRPVRALALLQWAMGLFALATLLVYGQAFPVMAWLVQHLPRNDGGWALFNLSSNGIALAIMLPATFCAGTTLPLITHRLLQSGHGEASIGAVYAANTLGAIAAVFFSIHLGMPILGLKGLLILGAALDILVGVALLWSAASGFATRRWPLALGTAAVLAVALAGFVPLDPVQMASGVYSPGRSHASGKLESLFHRDGKTATVSVVRDEGGILSIRTNGKSDAALTPTLAEVPSPDEPTMVLLGALPMTLRPQARNVACIGFGAGLTTQTLLSNPTLERVDTIEIEPEMVRGAELFRPRNELAYTDPRSHVVIEDAKTFFSTQSRKYDLIISEPSNPWVSGVAGLFSDEFYRLMRPHLAPGGLFVQWLQLYELDVPLALSVLKALEANFDDYAVYAANDSDLIIAASNGGLVGQPDPSVLMVKDLATAMVRVGLRNLQDLELRRVGTRKSWEGLTRSVSMRMNSDYAPVLDEGAARARFLDLDARPLQDFEKSVFPAVELLSGVSREGATTEVSDAGTFYFDGNRRAHEAMWLRDLLLGRAGVEERVVSSDELHGHARQVSEWLDACGDRPLPLASLLRVLQTAVPDLTVGDLDEIWWRLASSGCMRQLSGTARAWPPQRGCCSKLNPI